MLIEHLGKSPTVDPTAFVAPNAVVCGDVNIGPGVRIMYGAQVIAEGGSVRIHGVVHLKTHVAPGTTVPIGWVAVGNPAQLFPAREHEAIWKVQEPLNFPLAVYGIERSEANMVKITRRLSQALASHLNDRAA